jgi:hypothetical protein
MKDEVENNHSYEKDDDLLGCGLLNLHGWKSM